MSERTQRYTPEQRAAQRQAQKDEYQRIFSGGGRVQDQYRDVPGEGQSMYRHFTAGDQFANNDPTWQWQVRNGVLYKKAQPGQAGRIAAGAGDWQQASEFDQNHYNNWNNFLSSNPGATLQDFIGSKGLKLDLRQGDKTFDPATGMYYNDPGNDPSARQFFDAYGHLTGAPHGWVPPSRTPRGAPSGFAPTPGAPNLSGQDWMHGGGTPSGTGFDTYQFQPQSAAPVPSQTIYPTMPQPTNAFDDYLADPRLKKLGGF